MVITSFKPAQFSLLLRSNIVLTDGRVSLLPVPVPSRLAEFGTIVPDLVLLMLCKQTPIG